jgi:putative phosphoesterase
MTDAPPTNPADGQDDAPPVRVAILADTHGWVDPRLLAVVADCDLAVHGGDIGSAAVLARLRPRRGLIYVVRGNNDHPRQWPAADMALLATMPGHIQIDLPGGALVVVHGHRTPARVRHERLRQRFPHARALVYGHSHRLVVDQDTLPWVLNPGAAGRTRTYGGPSCLVLTAAPGRWVVTVLRFPPIPRQPIILK